MNPEDEWIIHEVPELRIVDDDLWASVKERQSQLKHKRGGEPTSENHFRDRRRPKKYLFSGLTKWACCGGGYTMISADLVGCATIARTYAMIIWKLASWVLCVIT